jgi:hypothetical protein
LSLAQDIAIGSNKSLAEVSEALAKAYGGNMKGLQALSPEIKAMIKDGATLDEVMNVLGGTFGGAAATAANTAAGRFKILKNSLDETTESIGAALLPIVQKVLPVLQKFADWAQNNPQAFLAIAGAITAISVAILAVNFAMALNPFTAIAAGVAALVVGIIYAYNKFEMFRTIVNGVLNGLISGFETFANAWINTINVIIRGMNLINPFTDIPSLPTLNLGNIGGSSTGASVGSGAAREGGVGQVLAGVPSMPAMPAPAAPLPSAGGGGGGSSAGAVSGIGRVQGGLTTFGNAERIAARTGGNVTINVSGGISTSAEIGESVVNAIRAYNRAAGPANIAVA